MPNDSLFKNAETDFSCPQPCDGNADPGHPASDGAVLPDLVTADRENEVVFSLKIEKWYDKAGLDVAARVSRARQD